MGGYEHALFFLQVQNRSFLELVQLELVLAGELLFREQVVEIGQV